MTLLFAWLSAPALAAGAFLSPAAGGLFADDEAGLRDLRQVRALVVQDSDAHVMLIQGSAEALAGGMAWLVPLPVAPDRPPLQAPTEGIEQLLLATDPMGPALPGCGACGGGCAEGSSAATFDSGELVDVRSFGGVVAAGNRAWFGADQAEAMLAELEYNGLAVEPGVEAAVLAYAAQGWGTLVVQLQVEVEAEAQATPVVALRVPSGAPTLPMLLSARSVTDELQAVVLTVGPGPFAPTEVAHTLPRLGKPLYGVGWTPVFYEARVRVAIEEAGGGAWVLEYSGAGPDLAERYDKLADAPALQLDLSADTGGGSDTALFGLFDQLIEAELLSADFDARAAHYTRWRTFLRPEHLRDQAFAPDSSVPPFEVTLTSSAYDAKLELLLWPALVGLGALQRRRRR